MNNNNSTCYSKSIAHKSCFRNRVFESFLPSFFIKLQQTRYVMRTKQERKAKIAFSQQLNIEQNATPTKMRRFLAKHHYVCGKWLVFILENGNTCKKPLVVASVDTPQLQISNHVCGKTSCVCKLCCASVALKNSILLAKTCILKILRTNCLLSIEKSPKKCYNVTKQCNKCIL